MTSRRNFLELSAKVAAAGCVLGRGAIAAPVNGMTYGVQMFMVRKQAQTNLAGAFKAIKDAGFELEFHEDLADRDDPAPWYWPLDGDFKYISTIGDFLTILRMTKLGRGTIHKFLGFFETLGLMPTGVQKTADSLAVAADCLVAGGKEKLFTPMYLIKAVKPKK